MRKLFTLTAFVFIFAAIAGAQTTTKSGKKRWGHFGFKTGVNFSGLRLSGTETLTANTDSRTGFVLGAFEKIPLTDKFDLQLEMLYSGQGGQISTGIGPADNYKLNYFSLPLLLKYHFFDGVNLLGGPEVDFIIKGKRVAGGVEYNHTDNLNAASVAFTCGVEKWFGKFVVLQGRYIYGINDVNKTSKTFQYINKGIHISLGVLLQ